MITREKKLKLMHQHLGEIQERYAVRRIGLFGSHVRNDAGSESDIDILVDFFQPTFDNYMDLKYYLEDLFNAPVDLVMSEALKPRLRPYISSEVEYVERLQTVSG